MDEMRIEYLPIDALTPYERNARAHGEEDIAALAESIDTFGFRDPIGVWGPDNVIVEGHGRLMAARRLGLESVPVIRLDDMTDEQRRAYALVHNRTAELSRWDETIKALELAAIREIDMSAFKFDIKDLTKKASDFFDREETDGAAREEGNDEYNEFLEKFEAKKTTDDCYTPPHVYDAVVEWVEKEYGVNRVDFVRPFFPGGDYQKHKYPDGCVVVDNPPFSIFSQIITFYVEHGVRFFLFGPGMTLISAAVSEHCCAICTGMTVTYENGANVNTSFVTNLQDDLIRSAPDLRDAIMEVQDKALAEKRVSLPVYEYPDQVVTAARVQYYSNHHVDYVVPRGEGVKISELDAMKEAGKSIFGNGYLLSEKAAAEKAAAEKAAAEKAAAEKAAATRWKLSDREWEIVRSLGKKD